MGEGGSVIDISPGLETDERQAKGAGVGAGSCEDGVRAPGEVREDGGGERASRPNEVEAPIVGGAENDVRMGTYGEWKRGAAIGAKHVFGVFAGTSIPTQNR